MEAAAGLFLVLLILILFVVFLGYCYRHRAVISKWLQPPYYAVDDRELKLKRRIEDAEKELETIEKEKAETGE